MPSLLRLQAPAKKKKKQKESLSFIRINCTDVCRVQLIVIKIRD